METQTKVVTGNVEHIVFQSPDTNWTVCQVNTGGPAGNFAALATFVGVMPGLVEGVSINATGQWIEHKKYGPQFKVVSFTTERPDTEAGLAVYLDQIVGGIGPVLSERIVSRFGKNTPEIMEDEKALQEINGIGPEKAAEIVRSWQENEAARAVIQEIVAFLAKYDLPPGLARPLFENYGFDAVKTVTQDPYCLMSVRGFGFKRADRVGIALGIKSEDTVRVRAGIRYLVDEAARAGHCYLTRENILDQMTRKVGGVSRDTTTRELETMLALGGDLPDWQQIRATGNELIYSRRLYEAETETARHVRRLLDAQEDRLEALANATEAEIFKALPSDSGIEYTDLQREAIAGAFQGRFSVITGGPGTGKTTITKAVVEIAAAGGFSLALASPTGKAAKRLEEVTGRPASTIHRLLHVQEGKFLHNEDNPLYLDMLIVDEVSMLDIRLAHNLLRAVPSGAHVVFVGDVDQLPSVGPGAVLKDLITSGEVAATRLDAIFRQEAGSYIIKNAHAINAGIMPTFAHGTESDFYLFPAKDGAEAALWIKQLVDNKLRRSFGYQAKDIQVLAPMKRGKAGVEALNVGLQKIINPPSHRKKERQHGDRVFRVGDRVIQIRNNYDMGDGVFNGDIGHIVRIGKDDDGAAVWIEIDGKIYRYAPGDLNDIMHAYALTIHKSQGSEFPVVIVPVLNEHYIMLKRNLIYTAVTRARELVVLVGDKRAIKLALKNNRVQHRKTRLGERIKATRMVDNLRKVTV
jgi:exodeoxyribonuclease V alpha subunit